MAETVDFPNGCKLASCAHRHDDIPCWVHRAKEWGSKIISDESFLVQCPYCPEIFVKNAEGSAGAFCPACATKLASLPVN